VEEKIKEIKEKVKDKKVIVALSGGVDSSVTCAILYKAIKNNCIPIFVDTGLLRKGERKEIEKTFKNVHIVDAQSQFFSALSGITEPEEKRKIIGKKFIELFEKEAKGFKEVKFLAQGTLYPDRIESRSQVGPSATIKTHHNVGGLPEKMGLKLIEPLQDLFKDEVREIGKLLGLPNSIVGRHPFPGPGLAVRIIGEVTEGKVKILQEADEIYIKEIKKAGLYDKIWQAFALLLPVKSVGVMGDKRSYENVIALRAVVSVDGMTASPFKFPWDILFKVGDEIVRKIPGINRVVYDITSKPPGTIEWE
jgi:GMP synthase (glutamine-hydrolysing)